MFSLKCFKDKKGATAIEYGLIAGAVALGITTGLYVSGKNTEATLCTVGSAVTTQTTSNSACSKVGYNGNGVPSAIDPSFVPVSQGGQDGTYVGNQGLIGGLGSIVSQVLQDINAKDPIQGIYGLKYVKSSSDSSEIGNGYNPTVNNSNDVESYSSLLAGLKNGSYSWGDNTDEDGNSSSYLTTKGSNSWNNNPSISESSFENGFDSGSFADGTPNGKGTGTMFQIVTSSGAVYNINGGSYLLSNNGTDSSDGMSGSNYLNVVNANTGQVVESGSDSYTQTKDSNGTLSGSTSDVSTSGFNP